MFCSRLAHLCKETQNNCSTSNYDLINTIPPINDMQNISQQSTQTESQIMSDANLTKLTEHTYPQIRLELDVVITNSHLLGF